MRDGYPPVSILLRPIGDGHGVRLRQNRFVDTLNRLAAETENNVAYPHYLGASRSARLGVLARSHCKEECSDYELTDCPMRLCRRGLRHHLDHRRRQCMSLAWFRIVKGVAPQLRGQNGFNLSSSVVDWAAKLVSPIGLHHAVDGGTNCACLPSRARSVSSSGTRGRFVWRDGVRRSCPPLPDRGREAGDDFGPLLRLESEEEGIAPAPNLPKETLELPPAAVSLGAGLVGKC